MKAISLQLRILISVLFLNVPTVANADATNDALDAASAASAASARADRAASIAQAMALGAWGLVNSSQFHQHQTTELTRIAQLSNEAVSISRGANWYAQNANQNALKAIDAQQKGSASAAAAFAAAAQANAADAKTAADRTEAKAAATVASAQAAGLGVPLPPKFDNQPFNSDVAVSAQEAGLSNSPPGAPPPVDTSSPDLGPGPIVSPPPPSVPPVVDPPTQPTTYDPYINHPGDPPSFGGYPPNGPGGGGGGVDAPIYQPPPPPPPPPSDYNGV